MFTTPYVLRALKALSIRAANDPIDPLLRGWEWHHPPIKPRAYLGLSVSDIASKYCPVRMDLWLRRKEGFKPRVSMEMNHGLIVHKMIDYIYRGVAREILDGKEPFETIESLKDPPESVAGDERLRQLYELLLISIVGTVMAESLLNGGIIPPPIITEYRVDGSRLGLSTGLRVDAISHGVIVEFKTGSPRDFHRLSLAGYALALESYYEIPVDYGLLVYIRLPDNGRPYIHYKPIYIDSSLRKWFLMERDEIIDMLLNDEKPQRPASCPANCPYREVCWK
ncbi:MAG: type I-A CRISPR-associated protein Cas4/Csa1 [Crenarchaeota archaeon]|nr:type I-A CRISPR-associated protein Cas4/Csa1 [Thermoproteota archaeon]